MAVTKKKASTTRHTRRAQAAVARKGRKPVPENESRHQRFIRLGTKRMNNVIRQIQLLGNLCSPNYDCDANDLALMRDTIIRELEAAMARFSPKKRTEGAKGFSFSEIKSPSLASH